MSTRTVTLHAFCSAKGGVGKSTLALTAAVLLAQRYGRTPVLIDADLTGTSLADGLKLCAPRVKRLRGDVLDLDAPPLDEPPYDLSTTYDLRSERTRQVQERGDAHTGEPVCIPFLNDALAYRSEIPDRECRIDAMFWRQEQPDGVLYLPSSSVPEDASLALGWLYDQERSDLFLLRFCWLLDELMLRVPALTDILIDLPPGLLGVTRQVLDLMRLLAVGRNLPVGYPQWEGRVDIHVNPLLVMTPDRNDWLAAMEFFLRQRRPLHPLLNRSTSHEEAEQTMKDIEDEMRDIGPALRSQMTIVRSVPTLGRLFRKHGVSLTLDKEIEELAAPLRLGAVS